MTLSSRTLVYTSADLSTITCGKCGGIYAISERFRQQKEEHSGYWNCPYCDCSWGYGTSTVDKLKQELDMERKRKEWAQTDAKNERRRRIALKGQVTKIKNRVGNGICPCCNRSFHNLARHMSSKHPDFKKKE